MLAVLSDLHFQDTTNDVVSDGNGSATVGVDRNVPPRAFSFIFDELLDLAKRLRSKELNIVLAGDIFDLNRSQRWFADTIRPYGDHAVEEWLPIARNILADIVRSNDGALQVFAEFVKREITPGVRPTFTIDIATRIPCEYRRRYAREIIAGGDEGMHRIVYKKLLEFDDLRPLSEIVAFMEAELPDGEEVVKRHFLPLVDEVLGRALNDRFFRTRQGWFRIAFAKIMKCMGPKVLLTIIAAMDAKKADPWKFAVREPCVSGDSTPYRCIVAGHTHNPDVEYLCRRRQNKQEQFYIDTGTWRQQIRKCKDRKTFARAKALTYAVFYSPGWDDLEQANALRFDFWNGYTKTQIL